MQSTKQKLIRVLNSLLNRFGLHAYNKADVQRLYLRYKKILGRIDLEEEEIFSPSVHHRALPDDAETYLVRDNQRLFELRERYSKVEHDGIDHAIYTEDYMKQELDLRYFRGDFAYLWQHRDINTDLHYLVTSHYLEHQLGQRPLLQQLNEDGLFGAYLVDMGDGLSVSRDLLDSVVEMQFLERHLDLSTIDQLKILDIGAGYGRLAYRMAQARPNLEKYFCVDAVPESTFVSEYYLRFRGVDETTAVVPLDEMERLDGEQIQLAINVHSFSECTAKAISWWVDLLVEHRVRYLMVVPTVYSTAARLETMEKDGTHQDYEALLSAKGYRRIARDPKYLDERIQSHGVSPTAHFLFELFDS